MVEPDKPQMTSRRMRAGYVRIQTHTQNT